MTNYLSNNENKNPLERLTVISEPLLSVNVEGNIDGFFAINYTNLLRKKSVFSNILEKNTNIKKNINMSEVLANSLSIKIYRVESIKNFLQENIIYDSQRSVQGKYFEIPNLNSKQVGNASINKRIEIGYLNVINVDTDLLNINNDQTFIEFYNFTDLDYKKRPDIKYRYKIQIELIDPMFNYAQTAISTVNNVLAGDGAVIGLEQILSFVKTQKGQGEGKNKENTGGLSIDQTNSSLIEYIDSSDNSSGAKSIIFNGTDYELILLRNLFQNNNILSLFGLSANDARKIYTAVNNSLSLDSFTNLSVELVELVVSSFTTMKNNLNSAINAIASVNVTNQSFGQIKTPISPINGKVNKQNITEQMTSKSHVKILQYGFDYLSNFKSRENLGLKQISNSNYVNTINNFVSRYYNTENPRAYSNSLRSFISSFLYSSLLLTESGVILPEIIGKRFNLVQWSEIFKILLLFIKQDAPDDIVNLDTIYKQGQEFLKDVQADIDIDILNSLEKSEKQLVSKGLKILPRKASRPRDFVEVKDQIQTDQKKSKRAEREGRLKISKSKDYFSSFVNNLEENKNTNNSLNIVNNRIINNEIPDIKNQSIPAICLVEYNNQVRTEFGNPIPGVSFKKYYENRIWSVKTNELFLDQYGEFFFNFVNTVRVEYLSGFDDYTFDQILKNEKTIDTLNNINISSYSFSQLTNSVLNDLEPGRVLLCKLVDFVPEAFFKSNKALLEKLKFFKKYYNYFLIIKGPKDLQIKSFGSSFDGG